MSNLLLFSADESDRIANDATVIAVVLVKVVLILLIRKAWQLYYAQKLPFLKYYPRERKFIDKLNAAQSSAELCSTLERYYYKYKTKGLASAATYIHHQILVERLFYSVKGAPHEEFAETLLLNLTDSSAIEKLCNLALTEKRAVRLCREAYFAPNNQLKRAEFFLLTKQWDNYAQLDPQNTLTPQILKQSTSVNRRRILSSIQRDGMTALLGNLNTSATQTRPNRITAVPAKLDWNKIKNLRNAEKWDELWELAQQTSAFGALRILGLFIKAGATISTSDDKPLFERLCNLAQKCNAVSYAEANSSSYNFQTSQIYPSAAEFTGFGLDEDFMNIATLENLDIWEIWEDKAIVRFSPDGHYLAIATTSGVHIWQTWDGKLVQNFPSKLPKFRAAFAKLYQPDAKPNDEAVLQRAISLEFSPDGKRLGALYNSNWFILPGYGVALFDMETYKELPPLLVQTNQIFSHTILFSSDNRLVVLGTNWLHVFELKDFNFNEVYKTVFEDTIFASDATFSPNGKTLIIGSCTKRNLELQFYDYPSFTLRKSIDTGYTSPENILISPDGKLVICGEKLTVWDTQTGQMLAKVGDDTRLQNVKSMEFSPGGKFLKVVTPQTLLDWRVSDGKSLRGTFQSVHALKYSPDGQQLIILEKELRLTIWVSKLLYLYNLPVNQATLTDLKWLRDKLTQPDITAEERGWLEFIAAMFEIKWRYEIEIEAVSEVKAGQYDIELGYE